MNRDYQLNLTCGKIMLSELWKQNERIHGIDRTLLGCPTSNMDDVYTLGYFNDVVYDIKNYGTYNKGKYNITVPRMGDLWRGIYFPDQDGLNVELWYGDKMLAGWVRICDLTFKDYVPIKNIAGNFTIKWDGSNEIITKFYMVKNFDRNRCGLDDINTDRVWMCNIDPSLDYMLGVYNADCYNVKK